MRDLFDLAIAKAVRFSIVPIKIRSFVHIAVFVFFTMLQSRYKDVNGWKIIREK